MMLSAEMFEQISEALKSDARAGTTRDKRLEPRVGMTGEVKLLNVGDRKHRGVRPVKVRDISRTGVGLYHTQRFAKDQRFIIELKSSSGDQIWMICITAYCRKLEKDRFTIGARIQQVLTPAEVQKLGRQLNGPAENLTQAIDITRISDAILS